MRPGILRRVHNICDNTIANVPWGYVDYMGAIAITMLVVVMVAIVILMTVVGSQ